MFDVQRRRRIGLAATTALAAGTLGRVPAHAQATTDAAAPVAAGVLPADLSVSAMFLHAGPLVQGVMGLLLLASLATWTVLVAKGVELMAAQRQLRGAVREAEATTTLAGLGRAWTGRGAAAAMLAAATAELELSAGLPADTTRDRVATRLRRIEVARGRRMGQGTGILATIGATAPFVGLFGTVWGIMNSFVGIAQTHTTNLAVVAPGIAEALLATATGLVAAIPAVVIYNMFARAIGGYRAGLTDLSAAVQLLVSRELDMPQRRRNAA